LDLPIGKSDRTLSRYVNVCQTEAFLGNNLGIKASSGHEQTSIPKKISP